MNPLKSSSACDLVHSADQHSLQKQKMAIGMQPPTRHFLTEEEKEEKGKLEEMVDLALANPILFISTDHKKAMAMTDADANTVETDLRNRAPQPVRTDIEEDAVSELSNSTRTSKAKLLAAKEVASIQKQYAMQQLEFKKEL